MQPRLFTVSFMNSEDVQGGRRQKGAQFADLMEKSGIGPSQVARRLGVLPQNVNNWRKRGVPAAAAQAVAAMLDCKPEDICDAQIIFPQTDAATGNARPSALRVVEANERHENSGEFVSLPVLTVELAAGNGAAIGQEAAEYELPFRRHTLSKLGVPASAARVVRVAGDSMAPFLNDGDVVGINTADTHPIRDGKTYAVRDLDMLRVKVLIPRPGGGLILRSVNSAEYPDEALTRDEVAERIQVIGRMFWRSGIDY